MSHRKDAKDAEKTKKIKKTGVRSQKARSRIDNKAYQEEFGVTKPTASRHLEALLKKGILRKIGTTGKGTHYVLSRKGLIKGSNASNTQLPHECPNPVRGDLHKFINFFFIDEKRIMYAL